MSGRGKPAKRAQPLPDKQNILEPMKWVTEQTQCVKPPLCHPLRGLRYSFMAWPGLRALMRSYPGLLSFTHSVGSEFRRLCLPAKSPFAEFLEVSHWEVGG